MFVIIIGIKIGIDIGIDMDIPIPIPHHSPLTHPSFHHLSLPQPLEKPNHAHYPFIRQLMKHSQVYGLAHPNL